MRVDNTSDASRGRVRDPKAGTILAAAVGGAAEAEFSFYNDSPDVAGFCLSVSGLAADWVLGTDSDCEEMAAASGGGTLTLRLTPPVSAALGDYDFRVWIVSGGVRVSPETPLVLRVEPARNGGQAAPSKPAAEPSRSGRGTARRPETVSMPAVSFPSSPVSRQAASPSPPPVSTQAPVPGPAPDPVPEQAAVAAESVAVPQTEPAVVQAPAPKPEPEPVTTAALSPVRDPAPAPRPAPPPPRPAPRPAAPPPPPEPYESEPVLVDIAQPMEAREDEDPDVPETTEPSVLEPPDGACLTLRPGETLLVRFAFTNDGPRERTYILDEDGSLEPGWVTLVKDQVNLTRNGRGEVSLRLKPPIDARPGDYPFAVTVGPQGDVLTSQVLTLVVAATPAVKIVADETRVNIGPFGSFADFPLSVESVGNADTAFRIAVKAPPVKQGDEAKNTRGSETVYETAQWRYLFDREIDTLRSAGSGRPPRPVNLRFRLQRRGPWWLGLQETHSVTVTAVPVTDTANGGKTENIVELTAVRRRFLPFPAPFALLLLVPLILLLVVKASYLGATNAYVANNVYYVLGTPGSNAPMVARLRWDAPFFAFVNVSSVQNGETSVHWMRHARDEDKVGDVGYGLEKTYEVTRKKITVRFVPVKTDHKLQITTGDLDYAHRRDSPLPPVAQAVEKVGEDGVPVQSATYALNVPRGRNVPLNLMNMTSRASSANIQLWVVARPDPSFFAVLDSKDNDQISPMTAAAPLKIRVTGASPSDTQELTLVTTDGGNQIVHIKLKAQ